jgi:hypothetical protein
MAAMVVGGRRRPQAATAAATAVRDLWREYHGMLRPPGAAVEAAPAPDTDARGDAERAALAALVARCILTHLALLYLLDHSFAALLVRWAHYAVRVCGRGASWARL